MKKIYWILLLSFTLLSILNQFMFYWSTLNIWLAVVISFVLEAGRLALLPDVIRKRIRFIIIYIPLALYCFGVNFYAFYQEMEVKRTARIEVEEIKKVKVRQNLTATCQNLTAILIAGIDTEIKNQESQQVRNAGILERDSENDYVKGVKKYRNGKLDTLEKRKIELISFYSSENGEIYRQILRLAAQVPEKYKKDIKIPVYQENAVKSILVIPGELVIFGIMIAISLFVEIFILVFANLVYRGPVMDNQKNQNPVKKLSNFDCQKSKVQDAAAKFDELIKNQKCRAWLDEKLSDTAPGRDRNGWRSLGNVPTTDRELFREFRELCNKNPEVVENYRRQA